MFDQSNSPSSCGCQVTGFVIVIAVGSIAIGITEWYLGYVVLGLTLWGALALYNLHDKKTRRFIHLIMVVASCFSLFGMRSCDFGELARRNKERERRESREEAQAMFTPSHLVFPDGRRYRWDNIQSITPTVHEGSHLQTRGAADWSYWTEIIIKLKSLKEVKIKGSVSSLCYMGRRYNPTLYPDDEMDSKMAIWLEHIKKHGPHIVFSFRREGTSIYSNKTLKYDDTIPIYRPD